MRGGLSALLPAVILFGVSIIGLTLISDVVYQMHSDQPGNASTLTGVGKNVSGEGMLGFQELGSWSSTIALVIAAGLIIGILITSFQFGRQ